MGGSDRSGVGGAKPTRPRVALAATARWRRAAELGTAALLCVAAAALVWPVGGEGAASPMPAAGELPPLPSRAPISPVLAESLVATNLFSGTRRPPTVRFRPPAMDAGLAATSGGDPLTGLAADAPTDPSPMADAPPGADAEGYPRLVGIVTMDGVRRAALRLSADDARVHLLGAGDRRGAVRVVSLDAGRVTLATPTGPRTLTLSPARPDSLPPFP